MGIEEEKVAGEEGGWWRALAAAAAAAAEATRFKVRSFLSHIQICALCFICASTRRSAIC